MSWKEIMAAKLGVDLKSGAMTEPRGEIVMQSNVVKPIIGAHQFYGTTQPLAWRQRQEVISMERRENAAAMANEIHQKPQRVATLNEFAGRGR
jgi:hypothetical protein